jgi:hypothetical protein
LDRQAARRAFEARSHSAPARRRAAEAEGEALIDPAVHSSPSGEAERARAGMRRKERAAAKLFVQSAEVGDVETFRFALGQLQKETERGMRLAVKLAARLQGTTGEIRNEFLSVWIMAKGQSSFGADRWALAYALRMLLPRQSRQAPLLIYRGATFKERRNHIYGFSWTAQADVARRFAEKLREFEDGAVVLETVASAQAILQRIDGTGTSFDESEVIVDPFKLRSVRVMERLAPKPKQ